MSLSISYSETFDDYSEGEYGWEDLGGFLQVFSEHFEIADHSEHPGDFAGDENPSPIVDTGIWGSLFGPFSGTQYVLQGESEDFNLGFIVQAADGSYLDYTFFSGPTHTLYGEIESITFGFDLQLDESTGEYSFAEELVSIEGLDTIGLNGGVEDGAVIDRNSGDNDTHNLINTLKDGDASVLEALLESEGVDLSAGAEELAGTIVTDTDLDLAA